jgi:hypothetical protein
VSLCQALLSLLVSSSQQRVICIQFINYRTIRGIERLRQIFKGQWRMVSINIDINTLTLAFVPWSSAWSMALAAVLVLGE